MIRIDLKKKTAKLMVVALATSLMLSGCGSKKEEFGDYGAVSESVEASDSSDGENSGSAENAKNEETGTSADDSPASLRVDGNLIEKLGGKTGENKFEHNGDFTAGGNNIRVNVSCLIDDTDSLPTYKVTEITADDVRENEIVDNFFGGTGVALNTEERKFLDSDKGDSANVIQAVSGISYHNGGNFSTNYTKASSWVEEDDFYIHVYEGIHNDIDYQLLISFSSKYHEKVVVFYPKNPGDLVGNKDLKTIGITDPTGRMLLTSGVRNVHEYDVNTIMAYRPNSCTMSDEDLYNSIISTCKDQLFIGLPKNGIEFSADIYEGQISEKSDSKAAEQKCEVVFVNEDEIEDGNLPSAVRNGFAGEYLEKIGNQSIVDNMYSIDYHSDDFYGALLLVNDSGLVGAQIVATYDFEEVISENASVMKFEDAMGAFEKAMSENLDITQTDISADSAEFNSMQLMYCPQPVSADSNEYYMIPAWVGDVDKAGSIKVRGIISAIDGSFIKIIYHNE